jgi:hypothetical protein
MMLNVWGCVKGCEHSGQFFPEWCLSLLSQSHWAPQDMVKVFLAPQQDVNSGSSACQFFVTVEMHVDRCCKEVELEFGNSNPKVLDNPA